MHKQINLRSKIINCIIFIVMTVCMIYILVLTLSLFTQSKVSAEVVSVSPVVKIDNNSLTRSFNFKYKQKIDVKYKSITKTITFQSDSLNKDGTLSTVGIIKSGDNISLYYSKILNTFRTRKASMPDAICFIMIFSVYILYAKKILSRHTL